MERQYLLIRLMRASPRVKRVYRGLDFGGRFRCPCTSSLTRRHVVRQRLLLAGSVRETPPSYGLGCGETVAKLTATSRMVPPFPWQQSFDSTIETDINSIDLTESLSKALFLHCGCDGPLSISALVVWILLLARFPVFYLSLKWTIELEQVA